jgi:hypothetical protein
MCVAKFGMHYIRNEHAFEQPREDFNGIDQDQVAQGAGICDGSAHALKGQPAEIVQLAVQFRSRDVMQLQKAVDFMACFKTQQLPQIWSGQTPGAIFFRHHRLLSATLPTLVHG